MAALGTGRGCGSFSTKRTRSGAHRAAAAAPDSGWSMLGAGAGTAQALSDATSLEGTLSIGAPVARFLPPVRAAAAVLAALAVLIPGCSSLHPAAYTAPVPESLRREHKAVRVVPRPSLDVLVPALERNAAGHDEGAARGAGWGALRGLAYSMQAGPFAPAAAMIFVPLGVVAEATGGALVGAARAIPEPEGAAAREALASGQRALTDELALRVAERLPALGKSSVSPDDKAPALRLEVAVDRWGLLTTPESGSMADLFLFGGYRVRGSESAAEPQWHRFAVWGSRRLLADWGAGDGASLRMALEGALAMAAEIVTDGAFLIHDFHAWELLTPAFCGLAPLAPRGMLAPSSLPAWEAVPTVDSTSPTLRWEPFPRDEDVAADANHLLARVSRVQYDLRIWKSGPLGDAGELVYSRQGLALEARNVAHTPQAPLEPHTTYLWSVRARLLLDGEERVTRWSFHQDSYKGDRPAGTQALASLFPGQPPPRQGCLIDGIPALRHHRFRTP